MGNIRFQNAIQRKAQATPPIWFMRQAGRYHSHYQALRKQHSFEELCKVPDLAAEVAMGPMLEFDFDVAILFSDILFPLEALGFGLKYTDAGPRLSYELDSTRLQKLEPVDSACRFLDFQGEAVAKTRARLAEDKSLIGFVGGPWTLFVYACEGGHSGSLIKTKKTLPLFPAFCEKLLELHTYTIDRQLKAGAEVVHVFDTAAGEISPALFHQYVGPVLTKLAQRFPGRLGYYSKGTQWPYFVGEWTKLDWCGFGYDHHWDLPTEIKNSAIPGRGFVQGNFDQALLHCDSGELHKLLNTYLDSWKALTPEERAGWVSGLGHGILPQTPEANVHLFIETVRKTLR
jgi:uroporphyrinogen decarboxylase